MKFKLLGTEIYISFLFVAIIALMLATDRTGLLLPCLFAVTMHEVAHLFAMWLIDLAPKRIRLIPASIQIVRKFGVSYKKEIFVALMGPVANLLLFAVLYFNYLSFGNIMVQYYSLINLVVGIFNLIPVIGLDGGTVLLEHLSQKMEYSKASAILKIITLSVCVTCIFLAIFMFVKGKFNPSVLILAVYFFIMFLLKI